MTLKYVKKAGMWCVSRCFNKKNQPDEQYWFATEEEAKEFIKKEEA